MPEVTRSQLLSLIIVLFLGGVALNFTVPTVFEQPVKVVHWANGHMTSDSLFPAFAKRFNAARHRTASGKRIEIELHTVNSAVMMCQLIARISPRPCDDNQGTGGDHGDKLPHPAIVTPAAEHWLLQVNHATGRTVVDLPKTQALAVTYVGIVTEPRMAECLGWPKQEIGIADIVALRNDPRGWRAHSCARAEWGEKVRVSFSDPNSSSTGRSMLMALFAIGAGKAPEQLSVADVRSTDAVRYVQDFNRAVDYYVPDTLILNSKIVLNPGSSHFYFIAEDNLVKLYQGKIKVTEGGTAKARRLERDLVYIYPKEGSIPHNHSAGLVEADWVSSEQREAREMWVAFLREDAQQTALMEEGFRPGTGIAYMKPTCPDGRGQTSVCRFTPDPAQPKRMLNPTMVAPAASEAVVESWGEVKTSGVVTFVLDVSGSMSGKRIEAAKRGASLALDTIHKRNLVGLVTFSDGIKDRVPVGPISENRYRLQQAIEGARVGGGTRLYDAVMEAVSMTDVVEAPADAIRGVVVLSDGAANAGIHLNRLIQISSRANDQMRMQECSGFDMDKYCTDGNGARVLRSETVGLDYAFPTRHRIPVFFLGVGEADFDVGRLLAEATGGAFRGAKESEVAALLEQFGAYF